jgi:hypothetical protein
MDYTPNIDAQGMRRPMGPVDQPNWNGGPKLIHNPQVMNNQAVGQPNLANAMANQRPIIPIRGRIVTSEQDIVPAEIPMDGSICLFSQGQAQIQYDMATNTCAITNAINNQTRDIIDNDNANYRALHDEMVKMQMDAKDQTIASQQAAINKLELTASQCAQNQYLVNQLRPAAVPAFTVPNPYANYGFGCYCGSTNNGCC